MAWELVAQGDVIALANMGEYENYLPEGSHNLLELDLRLPVTEGVAQTLEDALRDAGVEDVSVVPIGSPKLRIYFTKGFPWLAVIAATILGLIAIAVLVIAWRLFTYVGVVAPEAIPLLILAGIAAVTVIGIYLVRRKT